MSPNLDDGRRIFEINLIATDRLLQAFEAILAPGSAGGSVRLVERRASIWGAAGGRLLSVSPGVIDTPMGRLEAANEPAMADMVAGSPLRREGRPEEVAAVAVFLTSEAAAFVTGTDVLVDGGAIAAQRTPSP